MTSALERGSLAKEFAEGKTKLIPVIFSHGMRASRLMYQGVGQELASNGYIVFLIDHTDQSVVYSEYENGQPFVFDLKAPHPNTGKALNFWREKVQYREKEIK